MNSWRWPGILWTATSAGRLSTWTAASTWLNTDTASNIRANCWWQSERRQAHTGAFSPADESPIGADEAGIRRRLRLRRAVQRFGEPRPPVDAGPLSSEISPLAMAYLVSPAT